MKNNIKNNDYLNNHVTNLERLATLNDVLAELQNIKMVLSNNNATLEYQIWTIADIASWLKLSASYVRQNLIYSLDFPPPLTTKKTKALKLRWFAKDIINWLNKNSFNLPTAKKRLK